MTCQNSGTPCPYCGRVLPVAGLRSGKVGCRECRNVFFWDRSTGTLTPLASAPGPKRSQKTVITAKSLIFCIATLIIVALIFLHFSPWQAGRAAPGSPDAVLDEASSHLRSLAE